jgi:predicted DNA-binding transcriptional regulator AlpA
MQNYIRLKQLASQPGKPGYLPFSASTIWRLVKSGSFPQPIKLGISITAWKCAEVDQWLKTAELIRDKK